MGQNSSKNILETSEIFTPPTQKTSEINGSNMRIKTKEYIWEQKKKEFYTRRAEERKKKREEDVKSGGQTRVFQYEKGTMIDPQTILPTELFHYIISFVPVIDVSIMCPMVCKSWYEACNSDFVWREMLYYNLRDTKMDAVTGETVPTEDKDAFFARLDNEHVFEEATKEFEMFPEVNEWKKCYMYIGGWSNFVWRPDDKSNKSQLEISADGKTATRSPNKSLHSQAWGNVAFSRGVHKWRVKIDKVAENGFWLALGVTSDIEKGFEYNTNGVFTGYSGAGNIFSKDGEQTQGVAKRWKSGDIITIKLDCNKHKITFWINEEEQPTLNTLEGPLWPWANGYIENCTMTLLH